LGASAAILRGARRPAGDKPNLLFLWTDEQRADTLAAYGNHRFKVPNLNSLAAGSIVFDRCYDTQPVCTPARSSVMTGHWPHGNGCIHNNIPLNRQTPVLPEMVADAAYRTAYMGKWHLGDELFQQHGFEQWVSMEDIYNEHFTPGHDQSARSSYYHYLIEQGFKPESKGKFSRNQANGLPIEHGKPAFLAREASGFIRKHNAEPWMLYVNFLQPHMPFTGPLNDLHSELEAPLPENYPGIPVEGEPEFYAAKRQDFLENGFEGQELKTRAGWQRIARNYAGLCAEVDLAVGRILQALEESGQAGNTIVVFTTDHGDMMGAHSLLAKDVFYEEAIHIPMLLHVPFRGNRQQHIPQPVSHIDVVPTLLHLLGKPVPESLPGASLLPLLEGSQRREDHVFLEWHKPAGRTVISPDGWKMALYHKDNPLLFNRAKDPLEMHNLYHLPESKPVIARLRSKLEKWQQRVKDDVSV
jgi:arylsulfatase A-like enzyme